MQNIKNLETKFEQKNQSIIKIEKVETVKPLMICHHW